MPLSRNLLLLLFAFLAFTSVSCQKEEEKPAPPPKKVEEPLPAVTQERVDLWLKVSGELGRFVRKFSLEKENVTEKRTLMILVHGSARTQGAYSQIFDAAGIKTKEFWNILDVMEKSKKYLEIKEEEKVQNANIDEFVAAGKAEAALLKKELAAEESQAERKALEETLSSMEKKMNEFISMKGNITPASVGIEEEMIALWLANKTKMEAALAAMWKVGDPSQQKQTYEHM